MKKTLFSILMLVFMKAGIIAQVASQNPLSLLNVITKQNHSGSGRSVNSTSFRPCKEIDSSWDTINNVWIFGDSIRNIYNSSGNISLRLKYTGNSIYPSKTVFIYNGNGKLVSDTTMYWNGISYVNSYLGTYTYDVNNNQTQAIFQNWNGASWDNSLKEIFSWNGVEMTEFIMQIGSGTIWYDYLKMNFTYTNGQCDGLIEYAWNGMNWQPAWNVVDLVWYQSTAGNIFESKLSSCLEQIADGSSWNDSLKQNYTYDNFGNRTNSLQQSKQGLVYNITKVEKDFYQYDLSNNLSEDIYQKWNPATQVARNFQKRNYGEYQIYSAIKETIKKDNMTFSPNPFKTQTKIIFNDELKNRTIRISDVVGKEIKAINFTGRELIIERGDMKNGIYFVQFIDGRGNLVSKKIVVQ